MTPAFYTHQEICFLISRRVDAKGNRIPVTGQTVKNWRDSGMLPCKKLAGKSFHGDRIIYPRKLVDKALGLTDLEDAESSASIISDILATGKKLRAQATIHDQLKAEGKDPKAIASALRTKLKHREEAQAVAEDVKAGLAIGLKFDKV